MSGYIKCSREVQADDTDIRFRLEHRGDGVNEYGKGCSSRASGAERKLVCEQGQKRGSIASRVEVAFKNEFSNTVENSGRTDIGRKSTGLTGNATLGIWVMIVVF